MPKHKAILVIVMGKICRCAVSLLCAGLCVYGAYAVSLAGPRPSLYAALSWNPSARDLSLILENIGRETIAVPAGGFDIFVRPSPFDGTLAVLHIRQGFDGKTEAGGQAASVLLKPGEGTRIRGLGRFAAEAPTGRRRLGAVFEVAETATGDNRTWRGLVRTFPVNLEAAE